ncbi:hypothetical protein [Bordetella petrii]|uniref:hypothetical protein n=1 Tax=Bordetella petrii TaxID=94624 RepID=UPI001A97AAA2|nr:hypothetical protein [Bordetella petrii]MBO1111290.1 hypothetical protein [Bordetella petrii]
MVGSALHLSNYYERGAFAAVVANGLVGFGVNSEESFDRMMEQIHHVTEPGGLLVLGYNNQLDRAPFSVEQSAGCGLFEPFVPAIAGVDSPAYEVPDRFRHRYVFLRKGAGPLMPDTTPPAPAALARP